MFFANHLRVAGSVDKSVNFVIFGFKGSVFRLVGSKLCFCCLGWTQFSFRNYVFHTFRDVKMYPAALRKFPFPTVDSPPFFER